MDFLLSYLTELFLEFRAVDYISIVTIGFLLVVIIIMYFIPSNHFKVANKSFKEKYDILHKELNERSIAVADLVIVNKNNVDAIIILACETTDLRHIQSDYYGYIEDLEVYIKKLRDDYFFLLHEKVDLEKKLSSQKGVSTRYKNKYIRSIGKAERLDRENTEHIIKYQKLFIEHSLLIKDLENE